MIRTIYSVLSVLLIAAIYLFYDQVITEDSYMNTFSYAGTVATLLALMIAILEIFHSIKTTKSIQIKSLEILEDVQKVEDASSFTDCIATLDQVNNSVFSERYESAVTSFQNLRKTFVKVIPDLSIKNIEETSTDSKGLNILSEIEYTLLKATKSSPSSPLNKKQKDDLIKQLLVLKEHIESLNPAKRSKLDAT